LVKTRTHRRVTVPNRCFVNHSGVIERHANAWNPQSPLDSVVSRRRLRKLAKEAKDAESSNTHKGGTSGWRQLQGVLFQMSCLSLAV
ncbi:MAG TPA: hypothetical protein VMU78_02295, partial [Methylocella sp.]|nr:hypothetical protein [Methylocella sp.]